MNICKVHNSNGRRQLKIFLVLLQIREDTKKGIHVEDLKEVEVTSARDVMQQLLQVYSHPWESIIIIACETL